MTAKYDGQLFQQSVVTMFQKKNIYTDIPFPHMAPFTHSLF